MPDNHCIEKIFRKRDIYQFPGIKMDITVRAITWKVSPFNSVTLTSHMLQNLQEITATATNIENFVS